VKQQPSPARDVRFGLSVSLLVVFTAAVVISGMAPAQDTLDRAPGQRYSDLVPVPGATPLAARERGRVPCEEIVSAVDHHFRADKALAANVAVIAKRLGTTQLWVGHCMLVYGRRVPEALENEANEDVLEKLEEDEPEESANEDVSEPGARERDPLADENSRDRSQIRAANPNIPEKERVMKLRPPKDDD